MHPAMANLDLQASQPILVCLVYVVCSRLTTGGLRLSQTVPIKLLRVHTSNIDAQRFQVVSGRITSPEQACLQLAYGAPLSSHLLQQYHKSPQDIETPPADSGHVS